MVEVTRKNFEELLPDLAEKIQRATFLAIDAEYTGIHSEEFKNSNSLFDNGPQRYEKCKSIASRFITCQYGLAIFRRDGDNNIFKAETYKFYLFPVAFESFAKREVVTCQISCINFLTQHNFDFNKFFKEGVPYLNKEKSQQLRSFLKANRHFMHSAEYLDPNYFPKKINMVCDEDIEDIINRMAGFSKIIDLINESRKPVVGHNCLMDLFLTFQLFWENLPGSYPKFKSGLRELFPIIYDTKYLAHEVNILRRSLGLGDHLLDDTNLFTLYTNTNSLFELNMPIVETEGEAQKYKEFLVTGRRKNLQTLSDTSCHSADFDALVTGCIFLNLSYMAARPEKKLLHLRGLPPTFSELLGKTECFRNRLNVARAIISHVNLEGDDPQPHRPNWILAKSGDGKFIDPIKLKLEYIKHGDLEVDPLNELEVLIACGSLGCHRRVWQDLKRKGYELTEKCFLPESSLMSKFDKTRIGVILVGVGAAMASLITWFKQ